MAEVQWRIDKRQQTTLPTIFFPSGTTSINTASVVTAIATETSILSSTVTSTPASNAAESSTIASTSHAATSSPAAAGTGSSTSTGTLIGAIVGPIAGILIFSFIGFWLFMRRRHKKAIEDEPEFVMEGMKEKPRPRPVTADSNSSTQELVPHKSKEAEFNVKAVDRSRSKNAGSNKEMDLLPPRLESAMDSRPGSRQTDEAGRTKAIPNFSRGPRSNTAGRDAAPSPAPGFVQQDRSESLIGNHQPPLNGPGRPHQPRNGSFSRPLGPPPPQNTNRGPPPSSNRGPPPPPLQTTRGPGHDGNLSQQHTGAYNGSSPISQYSPIVKDMPKFGTSPQATIPHAQSRSNNGSISSINDTGNRKPPPSAIKTSSSPPMQADSAFSEENMRIARLANSSRLGFHSMVATTAATSPATEEPPTPSPRLPPPATRDAPPTNYNIPLPAHEPPAPASIQARLNGTSITDRRSVVSGLSDDYVDIEVDDNKSDVSSLDEREKWQMQDESEKANSRQAGLGGYSSPRPPLVSSDDSEASASQHSLGYYGKNNNMNDYR